MNDKGYRDPTAELAISHVAKEERRKERDILNNPYYKRYLKSLKEKKEEEDAQYSALYLPGERR